MIKKIIRALIVLNIFFFYFYFPLPTFAQGRCDAIYKINGCEIVLPHGCDNGYTPQTSPESVGGIVVCPCSCVEAGITNPLISGKLSNLSGAEFVNKLISVVISLFFIFGALAFFVQFLYGGIRWITSEGDKGNVEKARKHVTQAVIGLLVVFSLYVILGIIEDIFGINLKQLKIPMLTD